MIINHNIAALNTHRQLGSANSAQMSSMEKLSSGLRINSAKDDAAGLAISEKMRGQIRGLEQAGRNAQDATSLMQTAEGALNETHSILQRMRELTVQAGNTGTQQGTDLTAIQDELDELILEIDGISDRTAFNGKKLLNGEATTKPLVFQVGANGTEQLTLTLADTDATALTVKDLNITGLADTAAYDTQLAKVDAAIQTVSNTRSYIGANQNRLEHTINNLNTSAENLTSAESRIRDVDYAEAA